jgi:FkbM family methyltransferase
VGEWLQKQDLPDQFIYFDVGLAHYDGEARFYPPENQNFVSHTILNRPQTADKAISARMFRLSSLMQKIGVNHIDLFKMDIEGAEYGVLSDMLASKIYPRQVLVEFHHFQPDISILKTMQSTFLLLAHGYR